MVVHSRRFGHGQRPARFPALLHRLSGLPAPDRFRRGRRAAAPFGRYCPAPRSEDVRSRRGPERAVLHRDPLPAPLHLGRSLLRYGLLPVSARLGLGRAALPLSRLDLEDPALDRQTFASWLAEHGQSAAAVSALWDLICLPTVNLPATEASLAMAAKVFQTGLLTDATAGDIGWSRVPLGVLHGERAAAALRQAGVQVRLGEPVLSIHALEAARAGTGAGARPISGGPRTTVRGAVRGRERRGRRRRGSSAPLLHGRRPARRLPG